VGCRHPSKMAHKTFPDLVREPSEKKAREHFRNTPVVEEIEKMAASSDSVEFPDPPMPDDPKNKNVGNVNQQPGPPTVDLSHPSRSLGDLGISSDDDDESGSSGSGSSGNNVAGDAFPEGGQEGGGAGAEEPPDGQEGGGGDNEQALAAARQEMNATVIRMFHHAKARAPSQHNPHRPHQAILEGDFDSIISVARSVDSVTTKYAVHNSKWQFLSMVSHFSANKQSRLTLTGVDATSQFNPMFLGKPRDKLPLQQYANVRLAKLRSAFGIDFFLHLYVIDQNYVGKSSYMSDVQLACVSAAFNTASRYPETMRSKINEMLDGQSIHKYHDNMMEQVPKFFVSKHKQGGVPRASS